MLQQSYHSEIDWKKVSHIRPKLENKTISLEIKSTNNPLPRVMVITIITDPVLFSTALYSWKNVYYPKELLNWVIIDPKESITSIDDSRVRILRKITKYNDCIKKVMEMDWIGESNERPMYYTTLGCGDVWFPDTLSLKFRALEEGYDCVIPDTLAYYSPFQNTSLALKMFLKFPKSGMYWKKRWWDSKSSNKIVGIPYLGNCITVGDPKIEAIPQHASVRFFDNFPNDIKEIVKKLFIHAQSMKDESSESDGE